MTNLNVPKASVGPSILVSFLMRPDTFRVASTLKLEGVMQNPFVGFDVQRKDRETITDQDSRCEPDGCPQTRVKVTHLLARS